MSYSIGVMEILSIELSSRGIRNRTTVSATIGGVTFTAEIVQEEIEELIKKSLEPAIRKKIDLLSSALPAPDSLPPRRIAGPRVLVETNPVDEYGADDDSDEGEIEL